MKYVLVVMMMKNDCGEKISLEYRLLKIYLNKIFDFFELFFKKL